MRLAEAQAFAKYRLFRPLGFEGQHHNGYRTDRALAKAIAKWARNVLLGGEHYDLGVSPEGVFQIQSSRMNRLSYIVPVWNPKLAREVVLRTKRKSRKARNGCGLGDLERLDYLGGILVLNRVVFRGTKFYRTRHKSKSGWFVEDRYHFDVFVTQPNRKREEPECGETPPEVPATNTPSRVRIEPVLRVFHDSVGCLATPRWSPGPDVNAHNTSIKTYTPEYFPEADELIMTWHELAEYLGVQNSGVYALSNFVAAEIARGMQYLAVGSSFFWGEITQAQGLADLSRADDTLWTAPGQPLAGELAVNYKTFYRQAAAGAKQPFNVDAYAHTVLFESNLSAALVQFLLAKANGAAEYLGRGYFRLKRTNSTHLAAGTGNWGSAEGEDIGIGTTVGPPENASTGASGDDSVNGGIARLVVDYYRYEQKEKIEAAIVECRKLTSGECKECVDNSVGDTFQDLGVAADVVDVIGGIAACVLTLIYGGPVAAGVVCGITLPAAGNAAEDLWNNALDGYDYADDMCSGLPDASPTYTDPGPAAGGAQPPAQNPNKDQLKKQCSDAGGIPYVELIQREDACLADPATFCKLYSKFNDASKRLIGAYCESKPDSQDQVVCVWCTTGSS